MGIAVYDTVDGVVLLVACDRILNDSARIGLSCMCDFNLGVGPKMHLGIFQITLAGFGVFTNNQYGGLLLKAGFMAIK